MMVWQLHQGPEQRGENFLPIVHYEAHGKVKQQTKNGQKLPLCRGHFISLWNCVRSFAGWLFSLMSCCHKPSLASLM